MALTPVPSPAVAGEGGSQPTLSVRLTRTLSDQCHALGLTVALGLPSPVTTGEGTGVRAVPTPPPQPSRAGIIVPDRPPPLRGFRILDLCDELAVYATKLLVTLGAEVIRPEPPGGDPMRAFPPVVDGVSLYFEHFNAGKRSVTLDLDAEEG